MAHELEGVFVAQLFRAMRASVPESGLVEGGIGREVFESLLDERVASAAAERMRRGMGEMLYRQLTRHLPRVEDDPTR